MPQYPKPADIRSAIANSVPPDATTDRGWTIAMKKGLADLGRRLGWGVCTASIGGDCEREWLYDQVWYNSPDAHVEDVGLLVESEWSPALSDVVYDFEKLLIARCAIKVMIFQAGDNDCETFFNRLLEGIRRYRHSTNAAGEHYVLACWRDSQRAFEFREWPNPLS